MILEEGYGFSFAFAKDNHWASADIGVLHIWQGFSLVESYDVPGFIKGNLLFENGGIYIGPFFVSMITKEKKYLSEIVGQLATETKAHYSQYKIDEIFHAENDLTVVAISYQPPKGLKTSAVFSGATNRLLLFRRSDQTLLKVVAENSDHVPYSHLLVKDRCIVFAVDGYHTRIAHTDENSMPISIPGFIAAAFLNNSLLIGSGVQRILCYDLTTSKLLWQSPEVVELVNGIAVKDETSFLAAVNDLSLQLWKKDDSGFSIQSSMKFTDIIDSIAINPSGKYFLALSGTDSYIEILEGEGE